MIPYVEILFQKSSYLSIKIETPKIYGYYVESLL